MNKFNVGDRVWCVINYNICECIIESIYKKHDNIIYGITYDGYGYDMYDYELGKTKDELKTELERKLKDLQGILDSIK